MDSALLETADRFLLVCSATLLPDDREVAWAQSMVKANPNVAWAIGRYVQADSPNLNHQTFALADLQESYTSIPYAPLNINHDFGRIRGFYAASELLYPTNEAAGAEPTNPFVEALAGIWKRYFPQDYAAIKAAAESSSLSFSMEAMPTHLKCVGPAGCGKEFAYEGRDSANYCSEMRERVSDKQLVNPSFIGGALVLPPAKPAWSDADIYSLVANEVKEAASTEDLMTAQERLDWAMAVAKGLSVEAKLPNQNLRYPTISQQAFYDAGETLEMARQFTSDQRTKLAKSGAAMKDGSFPISNLGDLRNAIRAIGRANPSKRDAVKAHIRSRAKALGASNLIPSTWG